MNRHDHTAPALPTPTGTLARPASAFPAILARLRVLALGLLLGMAASPAWSQDSDRQQMKGLDEQVQEIKSDVLDIAAELSLLEEKLSYEAMRFAGVPASHVAFVEVWIDIVDDESPPTFWGVYSMVERVDNKYIANRFGPDSVGGNLYKASHAQRGPMDLVYHGEEITDYPVQNGQYAYGKVNNEAAADYSDIITLCRILDSTAYASEEEFVQALEGELNVDTFLRYMAVVTILDNWDTYISIGNNYYLFNNPVSGRFLTQVTQHHHAGEAQRYRSAGEGHLYGRKAERLYC